MAVVPAVIAGLVPDRLTIRWGKSAPISDVEGFLAYLVEADGLEGGSGFVGPRVTVDLGTSFCRLTPEADLWSMILAEELAVRLVRCQSGEITDGSGTVLVSAESEQSWPWDALESVGVISLFRPRPPGSADLHLHPLIPLEDCKLAGVSFNEEREALLDIYFDYWARPCSFLVDGDKPPVLLYRPMYRFRQAFFGASKLCRVTMKAPPTSRIYGALGVRGYRIEQHRVDRRHTWTLKGQRGAFQFRTRTEEAWLTRSIPLWYRADPLLLPAPTDFDGAVEELLQRKEQHWDMTDAIWGQEWYVAAHSDGTLNPLGRIYSADATSALLDLPPLTPKTE